MKRKFPVSKAHLHIAMAFVEQQVFDLGLDAGSAAKVFVAIEELLTNIILYSGLTYTDNVEINVEPLGTGGVEITLIDSGIAYNPFFHMRGPVHPLTPVEKRKVGGLGIYLVWRLMDKIYYSRENEKNILTLIKYAKQNESG